MVARRDNKRIIKVKISSCSVLDNLPLKPVDCEDAPPNGALPNGEDVCAGAAGEPKEPKLVGAVLVSER